MSKTGYLDEIFVSYQGEGILAGVKQIFIRFSLCNLECSYCDTAAAGELKRKFKAFGKNSYPNPVSVSEVLKLLRKYKGSVNSVSLTGGEPLVQEEFAVELAAALKKAGFNVYLETNGTLYKVMKRLLPYINVVAMDIKLPSSSGLKGLWKKHAKFFKIAGKKAFIKIIISENTKPAEIIKGVKLAEKAVVVLQPEYNSGIKKVLKLIDSSGVFGKGRDVRVIPQIHRFIGIK